MPSVLDIGPFSQPEWSDSSDSLEPAPLPQLGYFVPVRCRCDRSASRHLCRRSKRESPRSRRSISQCSCNSVSRRSSAAASPQPLPPLNNTVEMYVEPVVEDRQHQCCVMMNLYGSHGRNRSLYGTVRSMVPARATPIASMDDILYTPPYFYHIPPPAPLNTFPGRKRRKRLNRSSRSGSKSSCKIPPEPTQLHCKLNKSL